LQYSTHTTCDRPAYVDLLARVTSAASKLGIADPMRGAIGALFQRTFARAAGDSAYKTNRLQPGALPLEWSFSEVDPDALRIELQPFDPEIGPGERVRSATAELLSLVQAHHGEDQSVQFEMAAKGGMTEQYGDLDFGAFLGLVLRPYRTPEFKIYVELGPETRTKWCDVLSSIAGAVPHFRSVTTGACGIAERFYYLCADDFRLLDLETLCATLGMPHRFPGLLATMLDLTEGEFYLPPRSVLLAIRPASQGPELKIELVSGLAMNPDGLRGRIERLLQPGALAPFQRWAGIACPEAASALPVSVVSVKVSANKAVRLSVYVAEPWSKA
jgi:hypothetical protein